MLEHNVFTDFLLKSGSLFGGLLQAPIQQTMNDNDTEHINVFDIDENDNDNLYDYNFKTHSNERNFRELMLTIEQQVVIVLVFGYCFYTKHTNIT